MATIKHYHHHYHFSYITSLGRHFSSIAIVLTVLAVILVFAFRFIEPTSAIDFQQLSWAGIFIASFNTLFRLAIAYILALALGIPLALLITSSSRLEKVLLPIFDIIQSVPVLAFFPVIVLVFLKINLAEGAAIFVLFMAMVWNLVFTMIGGLKTIPQDIKSAASLFGAKGFKKLWFVTIPSIFPYIITGSLLAWSQGWNITIVAEVLHTYIPNSTTENDLFGLGSLLVNSVSSGQHSIFLATLAIIVILIGSLNFFVWQKLLQLTERYRYD